MSEASTLPPTDRMSAARAFAHSLNIVLKHVRLYGLHHKRSTDQFEVAWSELQPILAGESCFLLGVAGGKLLLNGVPLETGPAERSFAQLLTNGGISSIQFAATITQEEFHRMVAAFATAKPSELIQTLKASLGDSANSGIRVNEIRFVAQDAASGGMASEITATALGSMAGQMSGWLKDPKKLLQLISAAEGLHSGGVGNGTASGQGKLGEVTAEHDMTPVKLQEQDVVGIIHVLRRLGESKNEDEATSTAKLTRELQAVSENANAALYQSLFSAVSNSFDGQQSMPDLIKLAEHLAIRFAVESFERGESKIDVIHQILARLNKELDSLRQVVRLQEDKMLRAGLSVENRDDLLDRQFWSAVPEWGKKNVLLSADAWCIPVRNVRTYVEQLIERRDSATASKILRNYIAAVEHPDPEARRKVAIGIPEVTDLFVPTDSALLQTAILHVGRQLSKESALELQTLLSAAFVRLTQEAAATRDFLAIEQSQCSLQRIEKQYPNLARDMRPRVTVEQRLREYVTEAAHSATVPQGLIDVLRRCPKPAAEEVAIQFGRCATREECDRCVELITHIGPEAVDHLREMVRYRPANEAVNGIGLLSRLDMALLLTELPDRVSNWSRYQQDAAVRQIAIGGAVSRGELLLDLLQHLDTLILPEAVDEIGFTSETLLTNKLIDLASGGGAAEDSPYIQLKAVEALSRLRVRAAEPLMTELVRTRKILGWYYPRELRVAAAQALQNISTDGARNTLAKAGLSNEELNLRPLDGEPGSWVRHRRYPRVSPDTAISGVAVTSKGKCMVALETLSLGGGLATRTGRGVLGTDAILEIQVGIRPLKSRVLWREVPTGISFEIADITLEERSRLRKLIATQLAIAPVAMTNRAHAMA